MSAFRRTAVVLAALALPFTGALAGAGTAQAAPVPQGEFNWSGDQGDGFEDQAAWYNPKLGDTIDVTASADRNSLHAVVTRPGGAPWTFDIAAPTGQQLAVGNYGDAVRTPSTPGTPSDVPTLFANGPFGGCATLTGGFGITELVFGENGAVEKLRIDYNQKCEDRGPLRGYLMADGTVPPKPMTVGMTIKAAGKLTKGKATISGKVTCTKPARVRVFGSASQEQPLFVQGGFRTEVDCVPGKNVPWSAQVQVHTPVTDKPFIRSERLAVFGNVAATDPDLNTTVYGDANKWVTF
ncbi:hypothetical protein ACN20G_27750 (plasmid) [Streptomyces sp. BI20]|uniref:hypothetical protein n=1 Tax=Streptomyces sp. BI20 TaxID=3403460 RepID=UPI003C758D41